MKVLLTLAIVLIPISSWARDFESTELLSDHTHLIVRRAGGKIFDAPRLPKQIEFDTPRVAPNGKYVGWLALYPNCCTSYPIPLRLVVINRDNRLRTFTGDGQSIFSWCFSPDSRSVAFRQGVLHGLSYIHFELRRIEDGKLLRSYGFQDDGTNESTRKKAPTWAQCALG